MTAIPPTEMLDRENKDIIFAGYEAVFLDSLKSASQSNTKSVNDTIAYEAPKRIGGIYHLDNYASSDIFSMLQV